MDMKFALLIFLVFLHFKGGQSKPTVTLFPAFPSLRLYVGDEVTLRCKDGTVLSSGVEWYFNGSKRNDDAQWSISAVMMRDSGRYRCKSGSEESDEVQIQVHNMRPQASLSLLNTPNTVVAKGGGVLLELYMKGSLENWWCRYTVNGSEHWLVVPEDKWTTGSRVVIHAEVGDEPKTYWCIDATKGLNTAERPRSNAIKLIPSEKMVRLQMSERPAWEGDDVSLTCDVWGGPHMDRAVFYKDGRMLNQGSEKTFIIQNVGTSQAGTYSCSATYRFIHISKDAASNNYNSDQQVLTVIAGPPVAVLDCTRLVCQCPQCSSAGDILYQWHYTPEGGEKEILEKSDSQISSKEKGTYTCTVEWKGKGLSRPSNQCTISEISEGPNFIVVVLVILLFLLGLFIVLFMFKRRSKRRVQKIEEGGDGGYEQVGVKKEGGGEYELLQRSKEDKDKSTYETLKGQGKGEGEYEALKGGQTEVYHTLKEQEQGKGEYQDLKTAQAEVYHTLKDAGQAEGKGEYETLKTAQTEVYHTLKDAGKDEGKGEYEALKADQGEGKGEYETLKTAQAEDYQTLGQGQGAESAKVQAKQEESPYEELKAEKKEKETE